MSTPPPDGIAPPPDDAAAPLLDAWRRAVDGTGVPFTIPGHKRRAGRIWPTLGRLLGSDVPLFGGLDSVKNAAATLAAAEGDAAQLWGADWCRYLTGGSTQANQVLALALGRPGAPVLVSRNAHRSTVSGLVLAGLEPVWLPLETDPSHGLPAGIALPALRAALARHPDAAGVITVEPTYVGTLSDLPAIVRLAHDSGVPVVVDQAWAGHFGFHPGYPPHALQAGADAVIISVHKALAGYSQAALAAARCERLDRARLERAADCLATTSPAGSVLASIDASRALLASRTGHALLERLLGIVRQARAELRAAGMQVPDPDELALGRVDPAKLVVQLPGTDGLRLESALVAAGFPVEHADRDTIVPVITMLDDSESVAALVAAVTGALPGARAGGGTPSTPLRWGDPPLPVPAMSVRTAFFAEHAAVPREGAVGRVCGELIAPYPPGIPVLAPGDLVSSEALEFLLAARQRGTRIAYAADPALETLQVVAR